jgi:hypothetical protein
MHWTTVPSCYENETNDGTPAGLDEFTFGGYESPPSKEKNRPRGDEVEIDVNDRR